MRSRCWLLLLVTALIGGCSTVSSKAPVGNPASADDAKKLAGIWMTADGAPFWVQHLDGNEVRVASLDWNKDESRFELEEARAFLTLDDERHFINLAELDADEESPGYSFARVTGFDERSIVLLFPRVDAFTKAVEEGVLQGAIKQQPSGRTVELTATTEQLNSFVDPDKVGELFDAELAFPLHRVREAQDEE
jgi:uncharacterized protein YceK